MRIRQHLALALVLALLAPGVFAQTPTIASMTLQRPTLFWGEFTNLTVTLSAPAPAGGVTVGTLPQDPGVTIQPQRLGVAEGQTTAVFTVNTVAGRTGFDRRTLSAVVLNGSGESRVDLNMEPIMYSITLPARALGGNVVAGTVSMGQVLAGGSTASGNRPAPRNIAVTFFTDPQDVVARDYLVAPQPVVIPAGQTSVPFQLTTKLLPMGNVDLRAGLRGTTTEGATAAALLTLEAYKVLGLVVTPPTAVGNERVSVMVTLAAPAPPGGVPLDVYQQSSTPAGARPYQGSSRVVVAAGQLTGSVDLPSHLPVTQETDVRFAVMWAEATANASLKLLPPPPPPPTMATLTLANTALYWGQGTTGTVTLSGPAPAGGMTAEFIAGVAGNGLTVTPNTITFPAGQTTAQFQIATTAGTPPWPNATRAIAARLTGTNSFKSADLQMERIQVSLALSAQRAIGAAPVAGTATIGSLTGSGAAARRPAPTDIVIALSSSKPELVTLTPSVTIPAGQTSAPFTATPRAVVYTENVQITGTSSAFVLGTAMNLERLAVASVAVNPGRTIGGSQVVGTVTLNGQAGEGGATVNLHVITTTQANARNFTVPATVVVPAGQSSANFNITTTVVTDETPGTIGARLGNVGGDMSATLTLLTQLQGTRAATTTAASPMQMAGLPALMAKPGDISIASIAALRPKLRLADSGPLGRLEVGSSFSDAKRVSIQLSLTADDRCGSGAQVYNVMRDAEVRANTRTSFDLPGPTSLPPASVKQLASQSSLWMCAMVDSDARVAETDKNNNCRCARVP